jgi:small subunit ribosomal protein S2
MSETPATPEAATTPAAPVESAEATSAQATSGAERPSGLEATLKEQELSIRALFEAGVHYGHQPGRWNPLMRSYIFGERNGTHIIDLDQTLPLMQEAMEFLRDTTAVGGKVLFVGTKRQAQEPVARAAQRCGQYYVNHRWLGGMLTNWRTISNSIRRLRELESRLGEQQSGLTKKELLQISRERDKLEQALGGIKEMGGLPDILVIIDTNKESIAVEEATKLNIPVVAVVDSNSDPDGVTFPIPGNDDALRAIDLYCDLFAQTVLSGIEAEMSGSGEDVGASETPMVEPLPEEGEPAPETNAPDAPAAKQDEAAV